MRKLLIICGPTTTGKTELGFRLAKVVASGPKGSGPVGELVSADSRQVYKGMDIGTGKDLPKSFELRISNLKFKGDEVGYYTDGDTRIWGYDLVSPKERFSVADYIKIATIIIEEVWNRDHLPILVGGTGLYIKGVIDGIPTASVPRNESLRKSFEDKTVKDLFEILARVDSTKVASMNISDKKNPRRLIRAIEVALWKLEMRGEKLENEVRSNKNKSNLQLQNLASHFQHPTSKLFIGLKASADILHQKIKERTNKRLKQGIETEIQNLLKNGVAWEDQAMNSLGYKQWKLYFDGKRTKKEVIAQWQKEEVKYTKRQMVWFKRNRDINWFDISKKNWEKDVEKLVKEWYKSE